MSSVETGAMLLVQVSSESNHYPMLKLHCVDGFIWHRCFIPTFS